MRSLRTASWTLGSCLAVLATAGCRDKHDVRPRTPLSVGFVGCAPTGDGGAGGTLALRVARGAAPDAILPPPEASFDCTQALDAQLTATFRLRAEPAGTIVLVDGAPSDVVSVPLLPLVKDELMQHVSYWKQFEPTKAEVLARVRARAARKVELRGADQTSDFDLTLDGYELDDATYAALAREAARAPQAPSTDPKKGVLFEREGHVYRAGRERITLADFDWFATETETKRTTVETCTYASGHAFPLVAVATKVVVKDRAGAVVAEKDLPAPKRPTCPDRIFTLDGKAAEGPQLVYPKTTAWLDELAAKPPR